MVCLAKMYKVSIKITLVTIVILLSTFCILLVLNFDLIDAATLIRGFVIIGATIFTAYWTYKTFAHKEKISELKELKAEIINFYNKITWHYATVDKNQKEIANGTMRFLAIHNKLWQLSEINLYTSPAIREKVQAIVGGWITNSKRLKVMQSSDGESEARKKAWKEFEGEYAEVKKIIDKEVENLIS